MGLSKWRSEFTSDSSHCVNRGRGFPAEYRTARTKPELALLEIDRAIAAGVRFGCVLADAGYGLSAPFRPKMTARRAISVRGARSS